MSPTMVTTMTETTDVLSWEIQKLDRCLILRPGSITSDPIEVAKDSALYSKWTFKLTSRRNKSGVDQLALGVHVDGVLAKNRYLYPEEDGCAFILCTYDVSLTGGTGQRPFATAKKSPYRHYLDWAIEHEDPERDNFVHTNIMPIRDFVSKQPDLCPENKLVVQIAFTVIFDVNHLTLPNLKSVDMDNKVSISSLVTSYQQMWTNERFVKFSDFKIICGDPKVTFNVHKAILAARSPFFATYFEDRWANRGTTQNEYQDEDCKVETVKSLLKFIYAGELDIPEATQKDSLLNLIYAAEKYQLPELKAACFYRMFTNISDENAGEFAVAAYNYNADEDNIKMIRKYCARRHEQLIQEPKYRELFISKPAAFLGV